MHSNSERNDQRAGEWTAQMQPAARSSPLSATPAAAAAIVVDSRPFLHASTGRAPPPPPSHAAVLASEAVMSAWSTGQISMGSNFQPAYGSMHGSMQSSDVPSMPWTPQHPLNLSPCAAAPPPSNVVRSTEQALLSLLASAGSGGLSLEQQIATVQAMLAAEEAKQAEELRCRIQMQIQDMQAPPPPQQQQQQQPPQGEQTDSSVTHAKKSRHTAVAAFPVHPTSAAASTYAATSSGAAVPAASSPAYFPPHLDRPRSLASASTSDGGSSAAESESAGSESTLDHSQHFSRQLLESMREMRILERWAEQYAAGELSEQAIAVFLSNNAANLLEAERSELLDAFDKMTIGPRAEKEGATANAASAGTATAADSSALNAAAAATASGSPASPSSSSSFSFASSFRVLPAVKLNHPMWVNPQTAAEDDLDGVARLTFSMVKPTHATAAAAAGGSAAVAAAGHKRKKTNEEAAAGAVTAATATATTETDTAMKPSSEDAATANSVHTPPTAAADSNTVVSPSSSAAAGAASPTVAAAGAPARVLRVNKAWERLTGWTQVEAVEQTLRSGSMASMGVVKFLYRSDFVAATLRIGLVCQAEKISDGQHYLVIRTKDGRDVHVIAGWKVLFQEDGTFLGVIHSYQPLPEGSQMPPMVPGVEQTEAQLLWGAHATSSEYDWKAKLMGRG